MFKTNIGTADRVIRVVLGLALILGFFLNPEAGWRWLYLIGIVPLERFSLSLVHSLRRGSNWRPLVG